jgi:SAM-dependent methyltransferase
MAGADKPSVKPDRIMQYAWGYAAPLIIEASVRLRAFDELAAGAKTAGELAQLCGASPRGMRLMLNALVGLQLLTKTGDRYSLTKEAEVFLVSSKSTCLAGFFKHTSSQMLPRWLHLTEIIRSGKPATSVNQEDAGTGFFEQFVEDLFPLNYAAAKAIGESLGVASATGPLSVLDLACGSGVWGVGIAHLSPHVRVTAVDWPGIIPVTKRVTARHGVADRYTFVEGDLDSANFGSGHRIATLGHILHSEGIARSQALLSKTFAALAPGGTIAIAEWLVNPERTEPVNGLIFAVNMLVNTDDGDTFSFEEIRDWLTAAGFHNVRLLEAPAVSPLVLADKPEGR